MWTVIGQRASQLVDYNEEWSSGYCRLIVRLEGFEPGIVWLIASDISHAIARTTSVVDMRLNKSGYLIATLQKKIPSMCNTKATEILSICMKCQLQRKPTGAVLVIHILGPGSQKVNRRAIGVTDCGMWLSQPRRFIDDYLEDEDDTDMLAMVKSATEMACHAQFQVQVQPGLYL